MKKELAECSVRKAKEIICKSGHAGTPADLGLRLFRNVVHGFGEVLHVARRHAGHRNAAVLGQVHRVFFLDGLHLVLGHARVAKHADLVGDVLPVLLGARVFERGDQFGAHGLNAVGHALAVPFPLLVQGRVVEDVGHQPSPVHGWVRVHGPHLMERGSQLTNNEGKINAMDGVISNTNNKQTTVLGILATNSAESNEHCNAKIT